VTHPQPPLSLHRRLAGPARPASVRTLHCRVWVIASLAFASLAFASPPALATTTRQFDTQLTGQTPPTAPVPDPFARPFSIAVDATGDVWVGDSAAYSGELPAVTGYEPAGGYLSQLTTTGRSIALNDSTGELAVATETAAIDFFDTSTGALLREIQAGQADAGGELRIAIDNSGGPSQGRIYTQDNATGFRFHAYDAAGQPIEYTPECTAGTANSLIATDSEGNLYFVSVLGGAVAEDSPSGACIRQFTAAELPGEVRGIAIDPTTGNLLLIDFPKDVNEYSPSGAFLRQLTGISPTEPFVHLSGIAVSSKGYLFVVDDEDQAVDEFLPLGLHIPEATVEAPTAVHRTTAELHATAELAEGDKIPSCRFEYIPTAELHLWELERSYAAHAATVPCLNEAGETVGTSGHPIEETTLLHAPVTIAAGTTYRYRLSLANAENPTVPRHSAEESLTTEPAVTELETEAATEVTNTSAQLHASFLGEEGLETHYYFEYSTAGYYENDPSARYDHTEPLPPGAVVPDTPHGTATQHLATTVTGLLPGTTYHYRVVAANSYGTTDGEDATTTTDRGPTIEAISSSHVTATSADLEAKIDPQGFETTYRFSFGPTTAYGQAAPEPEGRIAGDAQELSEGHPVKVEVTGLQPGVTYHFRLFAENRWEPTASEDHTFEFFPPACPNSAVRQQTGSAYLPDCRAYELVSPSNANATIFLPGGPNPGTATSPSRFSYTGTFSSLPGDSTIETAGDLYVSTRTDTGWVSHYVGLPGSEAGCMGGPPTAPTTSADGSTPYALTDTVPTDPSMNRFLDFVDGGPIECAGGEVFLEGNWQLDPPSGAPYLFGAEGTDLGRLPTDLGRLPGSLAAFQCPYVSNNFAARGRCTGETAASGDLTHLVFSSNKLAFAAGGLTVAPGSAYDDDLATGEVELISKLPNGDPIPQDPAFATVPPKNVRGEPEPVPPEYEGLDIVSPGGAEEFLRIPAVSTDGSRVLLSTATASTPFCQQGQGPGESNPCPRFTETPIHLYMRVNDLATYEIAESPTTHKPAPVDYLDMTPDGSRVYFTSTEQLIPGQETDGNSEIYMWEAGKAEAGEQPLTLISKPNDGSDDTTECHAAPYKEGRPGDEKEVPWTSKCDALPVSTYLWANQRGARGGNGVSDSYIASEDGDIYFYSPVQLDGDRGVPGAQNLYDYRGGQVRYVTTLTPEHRCPLLFGSLGTGKECSEGPIVRIDVSPDGSHMAFLTASQLTPYDNAGHLEVYTYTSATETITCDSCNPDGRPATADVEASQDGLFMTDDGRTFFSTTEALVPSDTNEGTDVYEYVDGRPQLLTSGTGKATNPQEGGNGVSPGLVAVSANGTDVYFDTYDTLTSEDHNGDFLKFYDARTDGGFPQPPPNQPCAAAEECHGPGTEAPTLPTQGTAATLTGGNAKHESHPKHHKKKHHKKAAAKKSTAKHHRARAAHHNRRAGR
jgi:hypothetical protein